MKKIIFLVIFSCLLSACVTSTTKQASQKDHAKPAYPNYNIPRNVDKIIKGLEGCKKEFAFETIGLPTGEKTIDGKKYFEWSFMKGRCVVHANVNESNIIDHIYYSDYKGYCEHIYVRLVRYYRTHPAQSSETCPNRTDLQGNHSIK